MDVPVLDEEVTLSLDTVTTVWRRENFGDLHNILVSAVSWLDDAGERAALQAASAELAARQLLGGRQLQGDFRATLEVLARPDVECYGWVAGPDRQLNVLVAGVEDNAVLCIREGTEVRLQPTRRDGLVQTLVAQLPPVPAAHGRAVNLPWAELHTVLSGRPEGRPVSGEALAVFGRQSMMDDARRLVEVLNTPRTGGGQLYVAVRDRTGHRRRCPDPLTYLDTQDGRWMAQMSGDRPGERWLAAAPASRQLLISRLHEMQERLYR